MAVAQAGARGVLGVVRRSGSGGAGKRGVVGPGGCVARSGVAGPGGCVARSGVAGPVAGVARGCLVARMSVGAAHPLGREAPLAVVSRRVVPAW
jgi:hypothetical protein